MFFVIGFFLHAPAFDVFEPKQHFNKESKATYHNPGYYSIPNVLRWRSCNTRGRLRYPGSCNSSSDSPVSWNCEHVVFVVPIPGMFFPILSCFGALCNSDLLRHQHSDILKVEDAKVLYICLCYIFGTFPKTIIFLGFLNVSLWL